MLARLGRVLAWGAYGVAAVIAAGLMVLLVLLLAGVLVEPGRSQADAYAYLGLGILAAGALALAGRAARYILSGE